MKLCRSCSRYLRTDALVCPFCEAKAPTPSAHLLALSLAAGMAFTGCAGDDGETTETATTTTTTTTSTTSTSTSTTTSTTTAMSDDSSMSVSSVAAYASPPDTSGGTEGPSVDLRAAADGEGDGEGDGEEPEEFAADES